MLGVTFYKPRDYFSGFFNRFVTWMTSGDFCHCDLVIYTTPEDIMNTVKVIYSEAQKNHYAPEDCTRIIHQIESNFFTTDFRKVAQSSDTIVLAFSALWGSPMTVRILNEVSHDSWFQIPNATSDIAEIKHVPNINQKQLQETLKFTIEELGKDYDVSGALCSWIPWSNSLPKRQYETYFCSELVVTSFQRLGLMESLIPLHTTPNALFNYMTENL